MASKSSKLTASQIYDLAVKAGFAPDAAKTMTGIVLAESGGSPGAVGDKNNPGPGASSVGLSQINFLPSRDTGNTNRDPKANLDPLTNLKNAYKISNGGTNFSPWSTYTTSDPQRSYKQFMPNSAKSANSMKGSSSSSSSGVAAGNTPPLDQASFTAKYGAFAAAVYNIPELRALYTNAAAGGLTPDEFSKQFVNSNFYKTYGARYALMQSEKYSDPQRYAAALASTTAHVRAVASSRGIQLSGQGLSDATSWALGQNYGTGTINDETLIPHLVSMGKINTNAAAITAANGSVNAAGATGGTAYGTAQALRTYAQDMGVNLNDKVGDPNNFYDSAATNILSGTATQETYNAYIKAQAAAKYSGFANQINAGMTVRQIADPYLSSMQSLLEIPSNSVSFSDPTNANYGLINKALGASIDPTTGVSQAMPIWQFDQTLRADPRWAKTQNGQDSVEGIGHQVLKDMGVAS